MKYLVCEEFESLYIALIEKKSDLYALKDGNVQVDVYVKPDTGSFVFKARGLTRFDVCLASESGMQVYEAPRAIMGMTNIQIGIIDRYRKERPERKVHWIIVKCYQ